MEWLFSPDMGAALVTLTILEIVLGIDNVVFLSILVAKLPAAQQAAARRLGLGGAMLLRIVLLFSLSWMIRLTAPLLTVAGHALSGRDLILILGGFFLVGKSTHEIHERLEGAGGHAEGIRTTATFAGVLTQVLLLDVVFSLDSVITAVGMVDEVAIMVAAVVIAAGVMLLAAGAISGFVERHPTVKMLALSFLLLIGFSLVAEGFHQHIPKGYIYTAMAFAVIVEILNIRGRAHHAEPVERRQAPLPTIDGGTRARAG